MIAVLEFSNEAGLTQFEAETLADDARAAALRAVGGAWRIMTRENMLEMLPPGTSLAECSEGQCEVAAGRKVGADLVLAGSVGRFSGALVVRLKLFDTHTADLLDQRSAQGADLTALRAALQAEAAAVFGRLAARGGGGGMPGGGAVTHGVTLDRGEAIHNRLTDDTGFLVISTTPPGATLFLNGQEIGASPRQLEKMVGRYVVTAELGRLYHPARQELELTARGAEVALTLLPAFGTLSVASVPEGAEVWLEGVAVGRTPWKAAQQPSGVYQLEVKAPHYLTHRETVTVADGQTASVMAPLQANFGALTVTSIPTGAAISLNGRATGQRTPATFPELDLGAYVVKLDRDGYGEAVDKATVTAGGMARVDVELQAKLGLLSVTAEHADGAPCRATVAVDREEKGVTPLKLELVAVEHELRVTCDGRAQTQTVRVVHNEKTPVALRFGASPSPSLPRQGGGVGQLANQGGGVESPPHPASPPGVERGGGSGFGLGLSLSEGVLSYQGSAYRTSLGLEGLLSYRWSLLSFDLAAGSTVEPPAVLTVRPGLRLHLWDAFLRGAVQWGKSGGTQMLGGLLGAGYAFDLAAGLALFIEADVSLWAKASSVVPVEGRLGVAYSF
jgi:hypothetical protein